LRNISITNTSPDGLRKMNCEKSSRSHTRYRNGCGAMHNDRSVMTWSWPVASSFTAEHEHHTGRVADAVLMVAEVARRPTKLTAIELRAEILDLYRLDHDVTG